jgi:predicted nucleic acid-binding protein
VSRHRTVGGYGGRAQEAIPAKLGTPQDQLADSLIAATAIEHGLAVVTQDDDQMARMHAPAAGAQRLAIRRRPLS